MDFLDCENDSSFGPAVHGCRDDFDFTLKFQKIIFSILPTSIFIAIAALRIVLLSRQKSIVDGRWFQYAKLGPYVVTAALQLGLLGLGTKANRLTDFFVASAALECVASLCMAAASFFEHSRTPRPSIILASYLSLILLLDIAQTRTLWLANRNSGDGTYAAIFTVATVLRFVVLLLESVRKERWLRWDKSSHGPEETVGIFELSLFTWINRLLLMGKKKILRMPDLYVLDYNMTTEALQKHAADLDPSKFKGKKNGLAKALGKTLILHLLLPVAPKIANLVFLISKPLLIESLLDYLSKPDGRSANTGYGLIGATIFIYVGDPVSMALFGYYSQRSMCICRSVLIEAIYRKTTGAKASAADDSNSLTLMGTDVERIRQGLLDMHNGWSVPVQVAVTCFLLYRQLGAAFAAPIVQIAVCVGLSALIMRYISACQKSWMGFVEKRVGKTANAIANMKNIKISGLASAIENAIQKMRVDELVAANKFRWFMVLTCVFGFSGGTLAPTFTFAVTSRSIDVSTVFTSAALLAQLGGPLNIFFQMAPELVAAFACIQRVQKYLEREDREDFREIRHQSNEASTEKPPRAQGGDEAGKDHLQSASPAIVEIRDGSFGWEKDKMTLKNINTSVTQGLNIVVGPVASGKSTLCKALLGETPFTNGRTILSLSSTKIGFCDQVAFLRNGTIQENIIGYADMDDSRYAEVVKAAMLNEDLSILPHGDQTRIGSNGVALSGGQKQRVSIARSLYQRCEFYIFDDILSGLDTDTEKHVFAKVFGNDGLLRRWNATVVLCTHAVHHLPSADHIIALSPDGTIVEQGSFSSVMANKQYIHSLGVSDSAAAKQTGTSSATAESQKPGAPKSVKPKLERDKDDLARKTGDIKVFAHYFRSVGLFWMIFFMFLGVTNGFFWAFPNVWLKFWADDATSQSPNHSNSYYIGIYALLQFLCLFTVNCEIGMGYLIVATLSGTKLHQAAIRTVTNAPLRFFAKTDVGVVTNLFSQDMMLLDMELPGALLNVVAMIWIVICSAAVAATSSPFVIISYPFLFCAAYFLQRFYLQTSRQLRLLDLEAKSPLYTNFIDTMKGVVTFRAFAWGNHAIAKNNEFLNASTSPAYLLAIIQRWLLLALGLLTALLAILVVTLATQLKADSGFTGASMVAIIAFGGYLSSLINNYVELETSIGAVNRLKAFSDKTEVENLPGEDIVPPVSWPEKGNIQLTGISASYDYSPISETEDSEVEEKSRSLALRDLSVTIDSGQKVAICGRTGSGKSSFTLVLLRLLDPMPSSDLVLSIDDMPLKNIDRDTLRQRLIAVPQDPVFLPDGTSYMMNLDPGHVSTEAECQASLEAVKLWDFVVEKGGLNGPLSADSFSQGQKQLFSLARAILRRRTRARQLASDVGQLYLEGNSSEDGYNKEAANVRLNPVDSKGGGILILDEYSSSLDHATDKVMQEIIHREFEGYTIVMVSHRLEMVMGFDKVIVLDAGSVVEDGVPRDLAEQEGSWFRDLWLARPE